MVAETPVPEPKKGVTTSEFWLGVIAQVVVWYQAINPSFHVTPGQQTKLSLAAGALSLVSTVYFMRSRKEVKVAHEVAVAQVATAAVASTTQVLPMAALSADLRPDLGTPIAAVSSIFSTDPVVAEKTPAKSLPLGLPKPVKRATRVRA